MLIQIVKIAFILFCVFALGSCKCEEVTCAALPDQFAAWLPYKIGQVITYTNSNGQEIKFTVDKQELSVAKTLECLQTGYGCKCPECPDPQSSITATTPDTSRRIVDAQGNTVLPYTKLSVYITQKLARKDSVYLNYGVFDNGNSIAIGPSFSVSVGDSLLPSFTAGNLTYSDVIVHTIDTTRNLYPNPIYNKYFVWKTYYNKAFGIIAFYDLLARTLYYRKP